MPLKRNIDHIWPPEWKTLALSKPCIKCSLFSKRTSRGLDNSCINQAYCSWLPSFIFFIVHRAEKRERETDRDETGTEVSHATDSDGFAGHKSGHDLRCGETKGAEKGNRRRKGQMLIYIGGTRVVSNNTVSDAIITPLVRRNRPWLELSARGERLYGSNVRQESAIPWLIQMTTSDWCVWTLCIQGVAREQVRGHTGRKKKAGTYSSNRHRHRVWASPTDALRSYIISDALCNRERASERADQFFG